MNQGSKVAGTGSLKVRYTVINPERKVIAGKRTRMLNATLPKGAHGQRTFASSSKNNFLDETASGNGPQAVKGGRPSNNYNS
jgi:hypothetical protein